MNRIFHTALILLFTFLFVNTKLFSQTHIFAGKISGLWQKEKSPYYIDGPIRIAYNDKLVIEPGVEVIFSNHYKFEVYGTLVAVGTIQDSILFTAGNLNEKWGGIRFNDTRTESILQYCIIEYGWAKVSKDSNEAYYGTHHYGYRDLAYSSGGGIFIFYSNPTIKNVLIRYCYAEYCGGGIWLDEAAAVIENCYIYKNSSKSGSGGIDLWYSSNTTLLNCLIDENSSQFGGGIRIVWSDAEIKNCTIINNEALFDGGGLEIHNSNPTISDCKIENNVAVFGGGIAIEEYSKPILENLVIEKNNASRNGGGILITNSEVKFYNVTITENYASENGGGIYFIVFGEAIFFDRLKLSNIYLNSAGQNGDDLFSSYTHMAFNIVVDTFTVLEPSKRCVTPLRDFIFSIKNYKFEQTKSNLFISPNGSNNNSGLSPSDPLKTIKFALLKILPNANNPLNINLEEGVYSQSTNGESFPINIKEYVSLVSDSRADITWTADSIIVSIPWWSTNAAILAFLILMVLLVISVWRFQIRRIKTRSELERQKFEAQKLREIDEMKTRFFTNISHEFRTPLTLIQGPAKQILENTNELQTRDSVNLIHRSAEKLNRLVDQLLDLSKLEAGEMTLRTAQSDIIGLLKEILLLFAPIAEKKKIILRFIPSDERVLVYLDRDKFDKIITNILSNAFKFTAQNGEINVEAAQNENMFEISISDTGIGISKDRLSKIFDRFYQVDGRHIREQEGTGVGLALTKELVDLHKGEIGVESEESEGTTFTVRFPFGKEHLKPEEIVEADEDEKRIVSIQSEDIIENIYSDNKFEVETLTQQIKPSLLIVEDNPDVRQFIKRILENDYLIYEAINGEEGIRKSIEHIPDLIISDVMMPKMDGVKLCDKIKNDERTSHIPVILLTAKATNKDKIEGYSTGADDYIMKPFDAKVLQVRVKNLITQRKKLREHFKEEGLFNIDDKGITPVDKIFLQKTVGVINNYLSNTNFGVELFASELGVSRSLLHKKLVALIGETPSELIKRIRLSKAAKLLENNTGNISEIAIEVGFNNPAYFSDCFRKQFGEPPLKYQQKFNNH